MDISDQMYVCIHVCMCVYIQAGAELEAEDRDGWTPLHWAAYGGHADVCEQLVAAGVCV